MLFDKLSQDVVVFQVKIHEFLFSLLELQYFVIHDVGTFHQNFLSVEVLLDY